MNHPLLTGNDLFRLVIVDYYDFYDIAMFRDFPGRSGSLRAEQSELFARLFAKIVNRQIKAGSGDVRGYGLSQRAETYKTNVRCHNLFYRTSCGLNKDSILISSLQNPNRAPHQLGAARRLRTHNGALRPRPGIPSLRGGSGDVHKAEGVTRRAFSYGRPLTAKKLFVELY